VAWLCVTRCCRPRLGVTGSQLTQLLRRALPFALLAGFGLLYMRIDTIMLGLMGSEAAVGNYGVASRLLETLVAVPAFFGGAFLATVAYTGASTPRAAGQTSRALRYILLICVPLTFSLAIAAGPLVDIVAGSGYGQAGGILARLSPVLALMAAYAVLANLQIALNRPGTLVKISLAGVVLKVAVNAWAIPRYGPRGAAFAAVAGEALVVVAQWYSARGYFDVPDTLGWLGRLVTSAGAMVAVGVIASAGGLPWVGGLLAGLVVFGVTAGLTACISADELRVAWASLRLRPS
jgi:O-antigen/teichoic acid export membrane protein